MDKFYPRVKKRFGIQNQKPAKQRFQGPRPVRNFFEIL